MLDTKSRVNILFDIVNTGFICGVGHHSSPCVDYGGKPRKTAFDSREEHLSHASERSHRQKLRRHVKKKDLTHRNNRNSSDGEILIFQLEEKLKENEQLMDVMKKEKCVRFNDQAETFYYEKSTKEESEVLWYKANDYKNFKIHGLQSIYEMYYINTRGTNNESKSNSNNNNKVSLDMELLKESKEAYCIRGLERYISTSAHGKLTILDYDATSRSRKLYVQNILKLQANYELVKRMRQNEHQHMQRRHFFHYDGLPYCPISNNADEDLSTQFSITASTHSRRDRLLAKRRASQDERDARELCKEEAEEDEESDRSIFDGIEEKKDDGSDF